MSASLNVVFFILFLSLQILPLVLLISTSWNLTAVNLQEDALIWRFSIWRNRAFLAIPRRRNDIKNRRFTLVEAPWPEMRTKSTVDLRPFPNSYSQLILDDCYHSIRCAVALDIDPKGRLWVLDVPTEKRCPAKIIIFDLLKNDQELKRVELLSVNTTNLRALVINSDSFDTRAYIGDPGEESIIIYSLALHRWWKVQLEHAPHVPKVYTSDLAICHKTCLLYLTGYPSQDLFSLDLQEFQENETSLKKIIKNATVSWHGKKLGYSSGLFCDQEQGLHYFLTTDKASVRWDTNFQLKAENHLVLLQTDDVPYITHYAEDSKRDVWGLTNVWFPFRLENNPQDFETTLKSRTVNIFETDQYL